MARVYCSHLTQNELYWYERLNVGEILSTPGIFNVSRIPAIKQDAINVSSLNIRYFIAVGCTARSVTRESHDYSTTRKERSMPKR